MNKSVLKPIRKRKCNNKVNDKSLTVVNNPPPKSKNKKNTTEGDSEKSVKTTSSKMYFTQDTEDAIVLYNSTSCIKEREKIYNTRISQPFKKLVENIFNTFKFSYYDTDPLNVQSQVVSELTYKLDKYKSQSNGGGKAFSYFSIVAKNWLILYNNTMFKKWKTHTEILDEPDDDVHGKILIVDADKSGETREFIELMIEYWELNLNRLFFNRKELEIANAVIEIFRNSDRIDIFNKKALYLYIREISGCKTQHITKVINKMKECQKTIYKEYLSNGIVTMKPTYSEDSFFNED